MNKQVSVKHQAVFIFGLSCFTDLPADITVGHAVDIQVGHHMSQDWTSLFSTCLQMVAHWSVWCVIKYVRSEV